MDFDIKERDKAVPIIGNHDIDVSPYKEIAKSLNKDNGLASHELEVRNGLLSGSLTYHEGHLVQVDSKGNII